jgi:hypothetical protein
MLNEHIYIDVIMEPTPTEKQSETSQSIKKPPTGDGYSERQREEPLDDESTPKTKTKKSQELVGLESSLGVAWKPPAEGNCLNRAGNNMLAVTAQLALEDEEFEDMISSTLQLRSPMIMWMALTIQSFTGKQLSLRSSSNGIQ